MPEGSPAFQDAIQALYGLTYTTKFALRSDGPVGDYRIMPLEGPWWVPGQTAFWDTDPAGLHWTLLIVQPDFMDDGIIARSREILDRRGRSSPSVNRTRLARFEEGCAAQLLHVGPYAAEQPNIDRLHDFIRDQHLRPTGHHHEIYLGDPRRAEPSRLKTILRQPVA